MQKTDTDFELKGIFFADAREGWLCGGRLSVLTSKWEAVLLHTIDGGQTWRAIERPPGLTSLTFTTRQDGWGITGGNIVRTTDGGETWFEEDHFPSGEVSSMFFLNPRKGCAFGRSVHCTNDGGETWVTGLMPRGLYMESLIFADELNGWAVTSGKSATILRTVDGGRTWKSQPNTWRRQLVRHFQRELFGKPESR